MLAVTVALALFEAAARASTPLARPGRMIGDEAYVGGPLKGSNRETPERHDNASTKLGSFLESTRRTIP